MNIIVSVIIPTHNRSKLLLRAVKSVLAQSYSSFEIIIVDDASDDDTAQVIQDNFLPLIKSEKIRYFRNEKVKERSISRNLGMEKASGKYICLLDDDDIFLPNHLQILISYLDKHHDINCVFSNFLILFENGRRSDGVNSRAWYRNFSHTELCLLGILSATCSAVFRKDVLEKINGFNESITIGENRDFFSRLALRYEVAFINSMTAYQYMHGGSYSKINQQEYAFCRESQWNNIEEESRKNKISIKKAVIVRSHINLAWFFLPDLDKSREHVWQAIKLSPSTLLFGESWQIIIRCMMGKLFYDIFKNFKMKVEKK